MDFDLRKFIDDTRAALFSPRGYFAAMDKTGGYLEPVIRAGIYGIVAGVLQLAWRLLFPQPVPALAGVAGSTGVSIAPFITPIIAVLIGLFASAILLLIISAICGGSTNVEAAIRCGAALTAVAPVNALFGFVAAIHPTARAVVSFVITLYAIALMYHALVRALSCAEKPARIAAGIIAVIPAVAFAIALTSALKPKDAIQQLSGDRQQREELERTEREALEFIDRLKEMQRRQKGE